MNIDDHALRIMIRDLDQAVDEGTMPPLALDDLRAARARVAAALDRIEGRKVQKPTKEQIESVVSALCVTDHGDHFRVFARSPSSGEQLKELLFDAEKLLVAKGFDAYRVGTRIEVRA